MPERLVATISETTGLSLADELLLLLLEKTSTDLALSETTVIDGPDTQNVLRNAQVVLMDEHDLTQTQYNVAFRKALGYITYLRTEIEFFDGFRS